MPNETLQAAPHVPLISVVLRVSTLDFYFEFWQSYLTLKLFIEPF
jgi:hypothetical protein